MSDIRNFLWRLIPVSSWRRAARRRLGEDLIVREYVTTLRAKLAGISRRAGKIEILCLGSSHADYGFRPDAFPGNAFNFGAASQDLRTSAELAKRLVPTLPHLRKIVMFFSVFSPGSCLAKTKESFRCVVYEELLHVPVPESCRLDEKECARVRKLCRRERGEDSRTDAFGFNASMPGFEIPAEERVRTHLRENLREPDQMSHLEKMISETGVGHEILVVVPPARADYRAALPPKSELFRKLFALRERRGGFRIADFFDDADFSAEDFADTDHLNPDGAMKLSRKIAAILER